MGEIAVHELISDELPDVEIWAKEEVQASPFFEAHMLLLHYESGQEDQHIDNEQISCDDWYTAEHLCFSIYDLQFTLGDL